MDEDDWEFEWAPNLGAWHNDKYYGLRAPSGRAFVLDVSDNSDSSLDIGDLVLLDLAAVAMEVGHDGRLYYLTPEGALFSWGDGTDRMRYCYLSKEFRTNGLLAFNTAKVVGAYGSGVTLTIYCDGLEYDQVTFTNSEPCRLQRNGMGLRWSFKLEGAMPVNEVHLATSVQELTEATGG